MLIKWVIQYGDLLRDFLSVFRYFLRFIFEVMSIGLVHYGIVTLHRNYSHLILEHVIDSQIEMTRGRLH